MGNGRDAGRQSRGSNSVGNGRIINAGTGHTHTLPVLKCQCSEKPPSNTAARGEWIVKQLLQNPCNQGYERTLEQLKMRERDARASTLKTATKNGVTLLVPASYTLYSDEKLEHRARLEVPLQWRYNGLAPVIRSSLASTPCSQLGVNRMLETLNTTLRTKYTVNTPGLLSHLQACITRGYDFGMAYGRLRPFWYQDFTQLEVKLRALESKDIQERNAALDKEVNWVVKPLLNPRRVWDLYSNRVIPWWIAQTRPAAVSHSWMDVDHRHNLNTPINGNEWPVPIPNDTTVLERVRVELLNFGIEYVWLDVLCLRQQGSPGPKEALRVEEWKLDVPTIGSVYGQNSINGTVVSYFSGLGRPFHIGDLKGKRHWLNRAWTLQEAKATTIIAGLARDSPFPPVYDQRRFPDSIPDVKQFYSTFEWAAYNSLAPQSVFFVLEIMRQRSAENGVDRIGGLAYVLVGVVPTYSPTIALETAWGRLIQTMDSRYRGDLFFIYPAPGSRPNTWRPSWKEVCETPRLPGINEIKLWEEITYIRKNNAFRYHGYYLQRCMVKGLAKPDPRCNCRQGTMLVDRGGTRYSFIVTAHHQQPIPERYYDLVGNMGTKDYDPGFMYWVVVDRITAAGAMEKLSVLRIEAKEERAKVERLGLTVQKYVFLY